MIRRALAAGVLAMAISACGGATGPKTLTLGGATLHLEHHDRAPLRKYSVLRHSMLTDTTAILCSWPRDRHLHYFTQEAGGDYDVAFLDAGGKILETAALGRRSDAGITSKVPARHALFLKEGWLARNNVAVGAAAQFSPAVTAEPPEPLLELAIAGSTVQVETAAGDAERQRGLMHRPRLGADEGMLFCYPDEATRNFWMLNTLVPLDIAFFTAKGELINVQMRDVAPDPAKVTVADAQSDRPAQFILEVNQGWFRSRGICDETGKVLKPLTIDIPAEARRLATGGR